MRPRVAFRPVFIIAGIVLSGLVQFAPRPEGLSAEAWWVVSLAVLMVTWWVTEAVPIPVTSLLPMVILPMAGVVTFQQAASPYADQTIMLLMGGFIIARSVERWNLHARVALNIVSWAGGRPSALIFGFMMAAALLSMWISNTATTLMLAPIAISVSAAIVGPNDGKSMFPVALLLGVAWAASIGGLGTPVGTPTNLIVMGYLQREVGVTITFVQWMMLGLPTVLVMVPAAWFVVTRWGARIRARDLAHDGKAVVDEALSRLGQITTPEKRVAMLFGVIASLWIFRQPLTLIDISGFRPFEGLTDHVIAIAGAIAYFLVPSGSNSETDKGTALLDWSFAERIPWGALLLFGGGLSLASAISGSGLADWLGASMSWVITLPAIAILLVMVTFVIFATELTSNVATATTLMPIVGAIAASGGGDPVLLAAPVAMAASCAFMLPLATAPNAIVYATGHVTIPQMMRMGVRLNLLGIVLISGLCWVLVPLVFGRGG
jgi:sodium-dependent dicarboxylate transporter 2/3/5